MAAEIEVINWVRVAALLSAGICMGIGAIGPAIGQGMTGAKACEAVGRRPESFGVIMKVMFASLGIIEASAIYALIISILLVFWAK